MGVGGRGPGVALVPRLPLATGCDLPSAVFASLRLSGIVPEHREIATHVEVQLSHHHQHDGAHHEQGAGEAPAHDFGAEVLFGVHEPVADHPDEGHAEKAA